MRTSTTMDLKRLQDRIDKAAKGTRSTTKAKESKAVTKGPMISPSDYADRIGKFLKDKGIHILRYDSPAYGSVYLKFDYGVGNSLRISDHYSVKRHLMYRYNLVLGSEKTYINHDRFDMFFYTEKDIKLLLINIIDTINNKRLIAGPKKYAQYMQQQKDNPRTGFMASAREI